MSQVLEGEKVTLDLCGTGAWEDPERTRVTTNNTVVMPRSSSSSSPWALGSLGLGRWGALALGVGVNVFGTVGVCQTFCAHSLASTAPHDGGMPRGAHVVLAILTQAMSIFGSLIGDNCADDGPRRGYFASPPGHGRRKLLGYQFFVVKKKLAV